MPPTDSAQPAFTVIGPPPGDWFAPVPVSVLFDCTSPSIVMTPFGASMVMSPPGHLPFAVTFAPLAIVMLVPARSLMSPPPPLSPFVQDPAV